MGLSFNQGGTPMARASGSNRFTGTNINTGTVWFLCRFRLTTLTDGQRLFGCRSGVKADGLSITVNPTAKTVVVVQPRGTTDDTTTLSAGNLNSITTAVWYDLAVGLTQGNFAGAYFRATSAGSAGFTSATTSVSPSAGSGAFDTVGNAIDFGGRFDDSAGLKFTGDMRDAAAFEQGAADPSADIELFGRGYSPIQLVLMTLRSMAVNAGGTVCDITPGFAADMTVSGTAQFTSQATLADGPILDTAAADWGYVATNHIHSISVGTASRPTIGYDTATTTGNIRLIIDEAGTGRNAYHATASARPRFRIAANGDRRIGTSICAASGGAASALNSNTSPGNISNRNMSFGFVYAKLASNAALDDSGGVPKCNICTLGGANPLMVGTDGDGYIAIRIFGSPGTTHTPLLPNGKGVRFQSQAMPFIFTVSGEAGTSARTFTLYSAEGTATVTSAAYAANDALTMGYVGTNPATANRGSYGVLKAFDAWSSTMTAANAAIQLAAYQRRFSLASSYTGVIVGTGSSTSEGVGTERSTCANALYQIGVNNRVRRIGQGWFNTTTAQRRLTVAAGSNYNAASFSAGVFTDGETVTQSGGFSGKVLFQNGTSIYVYDCNTTAPTTANTAADAIVGAVSLVSRNCSGNSSGDTTNYLFNTAVGGRAQMLKDALNEFSGTKVAWINGASNAVNLGWTVADVVEMEKLFSAWLKINAPGVNIVLTTNIPRSGGFGNSHQAYNASIRTVTGYWDRITDYEQFTAFDFLTAGFVDDDGVSDYLNNTYYQQDDAGTPNDNIHTNEAGAALHAQAGLATFGGLFSSAAIPLWAAAIPL